MEEITIRSGDGLDGTGEHARPRRGRGAAVGRLIVGATLAVTLLSVSGGTAFAVDARPVGPVAPQSALAGIPCPFGTHHGKGSGCRGGSINEKRDRVTHCLGGAVGGGAGLGLGGAAVAGPWGAAVGGVAGAASGCATAW